MIEHQNKEIKQLSVLKEDLRKKIPNYLSSEEKEALFNYLELYSEYFYLPNQDVSETEIINFKKAFKADDNRKMNFIVLYYFLSGIYPPQTVQRIKERITKGESAIFKQIDTSEYVELDFNDLIEFTKEIVGEVVANSLPLSIIDNTGKTYLVSSKANSLLPIISKESKDSNVLIKVDNKENDGTKIKIEIKTPNNQPITPFERELQEAIGALMQKSPDKNPVFTPSQIFKELAGLEADSPIQETKKKDIEKTIDRLRETKVFINFTEQAKEHKSLGLEPTKAIIENNAIVAAKVTTSYNGKTMIGYQMFALPPFYSYSAAIKQIATVDRKLLNTTEKAIGEQNRKNTDDFIVLKRIILKMIEHMKTEAKNNNGKYECRRNYQTIFERVLGTSTPSSKKTEKMRNDIDNYLEILVKQNYIKSYEKYKLKRRFAGIKIKI